MARICLATEVHLRYMEFLLGLKHAQEHPKANGIWDAPRPWLNLFVSKLGALILTVLCSKIS
jgi:hypothetical protein